MATLGFGGKSAQLASYFQEVAAHFATLEDAEEKSLLAANAVEEVCTPPWRMQRAHACRHARQ
jgi:hypothetical protein